MDTAVNDAGAMTQSESRIQESSYTKTYYTEEQLQQQFGLPRNTLDVKTRFSNAVKDKMKCSCERFTHFITSLIPILGWLPKYKVKETLVNDIIAGFTVGVVHLPQGMAYGMLASVPPIHGLYVSFFPVIIYALLGTVRQVSIGTFAVVCIMIGEVVDSHVPDTFCDAQSSAENMDATTHAGTWTTDSSAAECEDLYIQRKVEIAVALSIAVGVIQVVMTMLRLGIITIYLSDCLVSGFTCGSAFHVLTSQITKLIGISVPKYSGPLSLIYTYIDIFSNITQINWATVIVSTLCIVFLLIGKEINARFHDKIPCPIPWEFAVVIFTTLASYYGMLYENYDVIVVGDIPTGLSVTIPKGPDIGAVIVEAIPIAVVAYAIEISLGKMFAVKHSYDIDSNQELFALGSANIFSAFFACFPCSVSLSRSIIWDEVGGKTQIAGLVSSSFILIILLWIGPLFESLPQAALAAIIVVNLKRLLRQFEKIGPYWSVCKPDAVTWVVTWTAVVLLGVDIGLVVGIAFAILTVVFNTQIANGAILGEVDSTKHYKNIKYYKTRQDEEKNVVIYRVSGPLFFANQERFKNGLINALGFDPVREVALVKQLKEREEKLSSRKEKKEGEDEEGKTVKCGVNNEAFVLDKNKEGNGEREKIDHMEVEFTNGVVEHSNGVITSNMKEMTDVDLTDTVVPEVPPISHVIIDMSSCFYVDNDGATAIKSMCSSLRSLGVRMVLSNCNENVRNSLATVCKDTIPEYFLSLDGAMEYAHGDAILDLEVDGNISDLKKEEEKGVRF